MKLTGSVIHAGREYHAGEDVPEGADVDRLRRLGLIASAPSRPVKPSK